MLTQKNCVVALPHKVLICSEEQVDDFDDEEGLIFRILV